LQANAIQEGRKILEVFYNYILLREGKGRLGLTQILLALECIVHCRNGAVVDFTIAVVVVKVLEVVIAAII
jgi:hypothetical protein